MKGHGIALLTSCQQSALQLLEGTNNVFLTGVAGSGKSFLIREFLKKKNPKKFPMLASTGAAAILVGGRTFHSFFGLGIMQGGVAATIERALSNKKLLKRLLKTEGVIIDEISMLSGSTLRAAETICRLSRDVAQPWGGLQIVAVGDFAQLPPVNPFGPQKDWAFLDETWERSQFRVAVLNTIMRTSDVEFVRILNAVRNGQVTPEVEEFLNERTSGTDPDFEGTRLFAHRHTTEVYNLTQLEKLSGQPWSFETIYSGEERIVNELKKSAPIPQTLLLKPHALVMLRQNDPQGRWFNGSLGYIRSINHRSLKISLLDGRTAEVEKVTFSMLNAEGAEIASATNFPVNLAYAATIHKAQGMTLDKVSVDLESLWEPGQAYVALSRVRDSAGLHIKAWSRNSIKSDPVVAEFNRSFWH